LAAFFGVIILAKWLSKKDVSRGIVYTHGLFAAAGLVVLIAYAMQNRDNYPNVALILFIIAALGGFYMFFRDLQNKMSPYSIAFLHGLLAVAGFVSLLLFAFA
jgi:membrane-associated protease RseP (regulator of RpoE activity)